MALEGTAVRSALDKPLHELTEDDIAQITREDCRRYLKEKGMRRPSWNKSQAIQQVIMLKALLETTPDSEGGSRKRIRLFSPNNEPKGEHIDAEDSISAGDTAPYYRKDLNKPIFSSRSIAFNNDSTPARIADLPGIPVGQMTIFYCGKVNVYDDVPQDKAQSILNVAGSPVQIPHQKPAGGTNMMQPLSCLSKSVGAKARLDSPVFLPTLHTVEGPSTRKASLQRYFDKKNSRFKSKRKEEISPCESLDMYFNRQMPNMPSSRSSNTCSSPTSTPNRCRSGVNGSLKNVTASTDLIN